MDSVNPYNAEAIMSSKAQGCKDFMENHLNPVILVFIG